MECTLVSPLVLIVYQKSSFKLAEATQGYPYLLLVEINALPQAWCSQWENPSSVPAVITQHDEMDLFSLISKPIFFSVENFMRPIRNHFL